MQNPVQKRLQTEVIELHITCLESIALQPRVSAHGILLEYFWFDKVKSAVSPEQPEPLISLVTDGETSHTANSAASTSLILQCQKLGIYNHFCNDILYHRTIAMWKAVYLVCI